MLNKIIILFVFAYVSVFSQIKEVTILHWNDFHARNSPYKVTRKDSTGKDISYFVGGTSGMLGYLEKFRDNKSLVVNGGDDFQGSPISSITKGGSQIELLNLYKLDAFVIGNHEFDYSDGSLDSVLGYAKFKYLSANTYFLKKNKTFGRSYVIKKINGVKFGIIGITTPELPEVTLPKNIENVVILNTDSVIRANINSLKRKKCDVIVLLSHCGVEYDRIFASEYFKDLDLIVGAHSHTPIFKPEIVNGVIIVQAGSNGRYLGKLDLKVDTKKDTIIYNWGKLIETLLDSNINDWNAQEKVDNMLASIKPEMEKVIGTLISDWTIIRNQEGNLGHFEADAFKNSTGADAAFVNGSGLRKTLPKGNIIVNDIWEINPFGNEVMTAKIPGSILRQMIINFLNMRKEQMDKGSGVDMLQPSGIFVEYDAAKTGTNDFIKSISINDKPLDENTEYTIATNSFIASQFAKFFGDDIKLPDFKYTGFIDRDVIIDAVKEQNIIDTKFEQRFVDVSGKY